MENSMPEVSMKLALETSHPYTEGWVGTNPKDIYHGRYFQQFEIISNDLYLLISWKYHAI